METSPKDYHHPYKPYEIQVQLMNAVYDCIAEGKIGIFESPTGTGKSLSLICSSLTWLRDNQHETLQREISSVREIDEPAWVVEHTKTQKKNEVIQKKIELEARLRQIRAKELCKKQHFENGEPRAKRFKLEGSTPRSDVGDVARFELDDYNSEDEITKKRATSTGPHEQGLSSASMELMEKLGLVVKKPTEEEDLAPTDEAKIYFCSRTHSQLTQFVQEVRRVDLLPPAYEVEIVDPQDKTIDSQVVKHTPLGSRKNLCINPAVSKFGSAVAINERCLDLQQPNTLKNHKCPFVPSQENEPLVNSFRDHTLARIRDIEDLGALGREIGICPYYASRVTIKPSELVTLPYPLLLQKSAREALGISLKGHIVIIDEAHNLMDTISSLHSNGVSLTQLKQCRNQLGVYLQKFRNRLKGKNRVYVAQVVRLIDSLSSYLEVIALDKRATEGTVVTGALLAGKGVDQINLYKLMHYLQESKLARKVEGYNSHSEEQQHNLAASLDMKQTSSRMPILTHVQAFLETLTNPTAEGRFFYEKDDNSEVFLKYMLLDPTHHFREIAEDARAVILAGGTMSPMDDYVRHLFTYIDPNRLQTFSCGHIIPKENLLAIPLTRGANGMEFDFTYDKRDSPSTIENLGNSLIELSSTISDGLVVFFPSYAYLDSVSVRWQTKPSGTTKSIWDRLQEKKPIFREVKSSGGVDDVLNNYSQAVASGKGALLLSVVGGKLSEGINFSDSLGRGVAIVGLPFPNIQSAQWKAKLEYIEQTTLKRTGSREEGKAAARDFYENACMRAVNQCIGRAIRHKGDYASILLMDRRFATPRIEGKLPGWIRQGIESGGTNKNFRSVIESLRVFFDSKVGNWS